MNRFANRWSNSFNVPLFIFINATERKTLVRKSCIPRALSLLTMDKILWRKAFANQIANRKNQLYYVPFKNGES